MATITAACQRLTFDLMWAGNISLFKGRVCEQTEITTRFFTSFAYIWNLKENPLEKQ